MTAPLPDADKANLLRQWLAVVLDQIDYTAGNCNVTDMVGAVIDAGVLRNARDALERAK